jgi:hypothetical protein
MGKNTQRLLQERKEEEIMSTLDEMWSRLETHQPIADARGYGEAWRKMCEERTEWEAAAAAKAAAVEAEELASAAYEAAHAEAYAAAKLAEVAINRINKAEEK